MSSGKPPIWVVIRAHVLADPRKTGALALLTIVMVGMYVRLLVFNDGPKTASAAGGPAVAADTLIAPSAVATDPTSVKPTVVAQRIQLRRPPATTLQRDPFTLPVTLIAPTSDAMPETVVQTVNPDVVRRIRESAGQLNLQSTFVSAEPLATINGRVLQLGDVIEGFFLERVEPTFVIVQKEGVSVQIMLK